MANGLEVLSPGVYTTVQDEGRFGFEDYGVPPSGAMDEMSFSIANALVGNPASTGALEFTLTGATLRLTGTAPCRFAVTGDMQLTLDDKPLTTHCRHTLLPGSTLRVIRACSGARGYLAVAGGFAIAPVMGSVSTLARAALGGLAGRCKRETGCRWRQRPTPCRVRPAGRRSGSCPSANAGQCEWLRGRSRGILVRCRYRCKTDPPADVNLTHPR